MSFFSQKTREEEGKAKTAGKHTGSFCGCGQEQPSSSDIFTFDGAFVETVDFGAEIVVKDPTGVCVNINGKVLVAALRGKAILSF